MRVIVTGSCGFIGYHVCHQLLEQGFEVFGIDSFEEYYSVDLKKYRLQLLQNSTFKSAFRFQNGDVCNEEVKREAYGFKPDSIIHLAAQPGVRLRLSGAHSYSHNNIEAFLAVLDLAEKLNVRNFLYASSSSVYGKNATIPFSESQVNLRPSSIYGVSKLANELFMTGLGDIALRSRGLRFFSVYGPLGRPDMAYFKAIHSAITGQAFPRNGSGTMSRDFTYINDVCQSITLLMKDLENRPNGFTDVVNIGGGSPVSINELISVVERITQSRIIIDERPAINEDLNLTIADYSYLTSLTNKKSFVDVFSGISQTIAWAKSCPRAIFDKWIG
jgi:UDP-glucuronate 4-epimerase